ncbi:hypothetical protein D1164_22690 [Mariniphaga sediminis]|jgi:hypothetical protein|uniref:Outer membrane protein beta-barrel domain-containing protein n=1 Tax=Mariniphaga sediminis TaxID=1628158 RepID=A0A399CWV2_9BACT|nr:hypothetical protein [Mariniphaga sediminis]RIH62891.1 hypothetical protein D1164_22690 [Mariniphaga sediminis]
MKKYLKLILLLSITLIIKSSFAQISFSTYSLQAIGISTDNDKKISGELKAFLNRESEDIILEPTIFYNFKQHDYHQISVGIGFSARPFAEIDGVNGLTIPVQLEISPIEKVKNFSVLMELTPQVGDNFSSEIRTLWGIRYTFR